MFRRSAHSQSSAKDDVEDHYNVDEEKLALNPTSPIAVLSPRQQQRRQELFRQGLLQIALKYILYPIYDFFHARTGPKGCRVSGWIRFWYAVVFLYSRTLFAIELDFLIDPINGVIPYRVAEVDMEDHEWTIFQWAPESRLLVYTVFYSCLIGGWGLLLGIKPRLCAVVVFFTTHMLHNQNWVLWDNQEHMFRLWVFFLIFMPLDHITVFDGFGGWCPWISKWACWKVDVGSMVGRAFFDAITRTGWVSKCHPVVQQYVGRFNRAPLADIENDSTNHAPSTTDPQHGEQSSSWPMWPFRIFQIYMCYVYLAAGLCKLNTKPWQNGTALWWLWYDGGFGRFFPAWVSEFFFNRMAVVKLQTWIALVIEIGCIFTIWIPSLRWPTFLAALALHIGIELALIMHAFEYLSVIGWVSFFVYPNDTMSKDTKPVSTAATSKQDTSSETQHLSNNENGVDKVFSKNEKIGLAARTLAPGNRKILMESILVGILLYFFTIDAVPRSEIMSALPEGVGSAVKAMLFPTKATRRKSLLWGEFFGIHAGAWTVYRGTPPHSDYSLTAVIQYNNGTEPTVWQEEELYERNDLRSLYLRERYYWSSTYFYYLSKEYQGQNEAIPYVSSFALYLARKHSDGYIKFKPRQKGAPHVQIDPNNPVKSISIMGHRATGNRYPKKVGLWESVPRSWSYGSTCNYVLTMKDLENDFDVRDMYKYNKKSSFSEESGCKYLDEEDEKLHKEHGSFEGTKPTIP